MMMTKTLLILILALFANVALAVSLEEAKRDGLVGEDASGYLAAVVAMPASDVRELVRTVNEKRKQEYQRIADTNQIAVTDVEQLAGRKAIEKTAPGHYIRLPGAAWQQK